MRPLAPPPQSEIGGPQWKRWLYDLWGGVGDSVRASDLASADPGKGADLVRGVPRDFATVADLLADTLLSYGDGVPQVQAGNIVRARKEGYSYEVVSQEASDHHVETAGGVKLYVRGPVVTPAMFGAPSSGDASAEIQAAIDAASELGAVFVSDRPYELASGVSISSPVRALFTAPWTSTAASGAMLTITSSDVRIEGFDLTHQNDNENQVVGIEVEGTSEAPLRNVAIVGARFSRIGFHGLRMTYVEDCHVDDLYAVNINKGSSSQRVGTPAITSSKRCTVSNIRNYNCDGKTVVFALSEDCTAINIVSVAGDATNSNEAFYVNGCLRVHAANVVAIGKSNYGVKFSRDSQECAITNAHLEGGNAGFSYHGSSRCRAIGVRAFGLGDGRPCLVSSHDATGTASHENLSIGCVFRAPESPVRVTTSPDDTEEVCTGNTFIDCDFEVGDGTRFFESLRANKTTLINCEGRASADLGMTFNSAGSDCEVRGGLYTASGAVISVFGDGTRVSGVRAISSEGVGIRLVAPCRISNSEFMGVNSILYSRNEADVVVEFCHLPDGEDGSSGSVTKNYNTPVA